MLKLSVQTIGDFKRFWFRLIFRWQWVEFCGFWTTNRRKAILLRARRSPSTRPWPSATWTSPSRLTCSSRWKKPLQFYRWTFTTVEFLQFYKWRRFLRNFMFTFQFWDLKKLKSTNGKTCLQRHKMDYLLLKGIPYHVFHGLPAFKRNTMFLMDYLLLKGIPCF